MLRKLLTVAIVTLVVSGCGTNPVTGKPELQLVSESEEITLGRENYVPTQQAQGGQYRVDADLAAYVSEVGQRVALVSDRELPYEFVLLNNSTPNAWALPGGKIAINRGLLTILESEAELAAVLAHEVVHSAARHSAKYMERNIFIQGALKATQLALEGKQSSDYIIGGAQVGVNLLSLKYSRFDELEADRIGQLYMARAGYDPEAAVTLQEKFVELSGQHQDWVDGILATHPHSSDRLQKNSENAARLAYQMNRTDWDLGADRYQEKLKYLRSKQAAYDAFDQATSLAAAGELDVANTRLEKAISIEPDEAQFYGLKAKLLFNAEQWREAIRYYNKALERDPDYYDYYLGRGMSYSKLGQARKARADLEASVALLPTANASYALGNLYIDAGDSSNAKKHLMRVVATDGPLKFEAQKSFTRIDMVETPELYFLASSKVEDMQFVSIITNQTPFPAKRLRVKFEATINGERKQKTIRTGAIGGNSQLKLKPGWSFVATDQIENVYVRVVDVSI